MIFGHSSYVIIVGNETCLIKGRASRTFSSNFLSMSFQFSHLVENVFSGYINGV